MKVTELNIYLNRFLGDFIPIVPFLAVLMSKNGLSLSQISLAFFTLAATVFILELPTGMIADKVSVKLILILSRFFKLLSFIVIFAIPNLTGATLGMALWGIASAFDSGAFQSYLFNYIKKTRDIKHFEIIYARSITASLLGLLAAMAVSTQIEYLGYEILQVIGIVTLSFSFISTLFLSTVSEASHTIEKTSVNFIHTARQAFRTIHHTPLLLSLLAIGILAGGIKGSLDDYTSLLLVNKELSLAAVGYILLTFEIVRSSGAFFSQWIKVEHIAQAVLLGLFGAGFVLAGSFGPFIAIAALFSIIILDAMLWVHNDTAIQRLAYDGNRATLASLKNFGTEITAALVLLFIFLTGEHLSLNSIYIILGTILLVGSSLIALNFIKQNRLR